MTSKITHVAQLAQEVHNGGVEASRIGKNLQKRVSLWVSRKECVIENGILKLV